MSANATFTRDGGLGVIALDRPRLRPVESEQARALSIRSTPPTRSAVSRISSSR
jgi:hypothetical protein